MNEESHLQAHQNITQDNTAGGKKKWQKAKMCRNFVRRNLSYVDLVFYLALDHAEHNAMDAKTFFTLLFLSTYVSFFSLLPEN